VSVESVEVALSELLLGIIEGDVGGVVEIEDVLIVFEVLV